MSISTESSMASVPQPPTIYIVRHGETEWNMQERFQGKLDSPLTDNGIQQAQNKAIFFNTCLPIDRIYCSPLGRAQATAAILAQALKCPIETVESLYEIDMGDFGGMKISEMKEIYRVWYHRRNKRKPFVPFPNGESYFDVYLRIRSFISTIMKKKQRIIIVAHEGINRILRGIIIGESLHESVKWRQGHNQIFEVRPQREILHTLDKNGWKIHP